ncbi:hypothetical protein BZA05DRAFT_405443 [Tricharina praecox]|uniref:uncharacterized protein n=1 Tax=Tricharina praecox TaxID=43433 RepID=UPI002221041F|nr:uncharacterized protein BZA05DRAFT_411443 [Tricharina praecox]XP_051337426.1 uncharacterized protein BZA05DRAFT_405443 [Tricharina praecox]KAI5843210.1 hypothetical protein BZA05DRAFT_411443 [Tricharina praecox]KAI5847617.1 hypothetical protein BZA05DRAFT_405443 [Tricharina praecox]
MRPCVYIFVSGGEGEDDGEDGDGDGAGGGEGRGRGVEVHEVDPHEFGGVAETALQELTPYFLENPSVPLEHHVGVLLGWLHRVFRECAGPEERYERFQVLDFYMLFRQCGKMLLKLEAGRGLFLGAFEEVAARTWVDGELGNRWVGEQAGFTENLKTGARLWTRIAVLGGPKEKWPSLWRACERRRRWEAGEMKVETATEVNGEGEGKGTQPCLQDEKEKGKKECLNMGEKLYRQQPEVRTNGDTPELQQEANDKDDIFIGFDPAIDSIYNATTCLDFNSFLIHSLTQLSRNLTELESYASSSPRTGLPEDEKAAFTTLHRHIHLSVRVFYNLFHDSSGILQSHLHWVAAVLGKDKRHATSRSVHDILELPRPGTIYRGPSVRPLAQGASLWARACAEWLKLIYRPMECVHRFQGSRGFCTLRKVLQDCDVAIVRCKLGDRRMAAWEDVVRSVVEGCPRIFKPEHADMLIAHFRDEARKADRASPLKKLLGDWTFEGCVHPLAALAGLRSAAVERSSQKAKAKRGKKSTIPHSRSHQRPAYHDPANNPFATSEFQCIGGLVGISHTPCAVCNMLAEHALDVSRSSNVVAPCALPPIMSATQRVNVMRTVERRLEDVLMELLEVVDPDPNLSELSTRAGGVGGQRQARWV